jgi:GT2 family glycosyltransferase
MSQTESSSLPTHYSMRKELKPEAAIDVSFIIVNWNAKDYLRRCLNSLEGAKDGLVTETIVVDNGSSDGSAEMVSNEFPDVKVVQTGSNLGFAKGNNIGIAESRGQYLCLVNSDVDVFPDAIIRLRGLMEEDPSIGIAGPKVSNTDGTPQSNCRNAPTIWNSLCRAFSLDTLFPRYGIFRDGLALFPTGDQPIEVEVLSGCFWFLRRESLQSVGKLDQRFFMYGEDLDWCRRFHDAGWKVVYAPESRVVHHGGASSADAPLRFFIELHRGQLLYWRKYHSFGASAGYLVTLWAHNALRVVGYALLCLLGGGKRCDAQYKVARSWQCLKWLATEGYRCLNQPSTQGGSIELGLTAKPEPRGN